MKAFKKIACLIIAVLMLGCLVACESDDGSLSAYLEENGISEEELNAIVASYSDQIVGSDDGTGNDISSYVTNGSDILPEAFIGYWEVDSIYQYAVASDISEYEALNREKENDVFFDYNSFSRYGDSVSNAVFTVNENATYSDMEAYGIQTATLRSNFGDDAKVTSVVVKNSSGDVCTTVYLVNNTKLVAFGAGMNVYTYSYLDSALG